MRLLTREALLSFRRAPLLSALSITTIAFSLFTLGLFGLVAINLREALRGIEERVEIVAFVLRGTPAETITLATQDIAAFPEVQDVSFVSEEQALERARAELVEFRDAYRDIKANPLPASIEVRMKEGFRSSASVERVAERIRGFGFVDDVRYGRDWVQRLDQLRNVTGLVGLVIGLAFAARRGGHHRRDHPAHHSPAGPRDLDHAAGRRDQLVHPGPLPARGGAQGPARRVPLAGALLRRLSPLPRYTGGPFAGLIFFRPEHMLVIIVFGVLLGLAGSLVSVGRHLRNV